MWKRSFRARPPSKSESWRCENEAFVRDLLQSLNAEDVKTKLLCETSFKFWNWKLLCHAMSFHSIPSIIPFQSSPYQPNPLQYIPFHSNPIHSIPFQYNPFHSNPFHSTPIQSIPFRSVPFHSIHSWPSYISVTRKFLRPNFLWFFIVYGNGIYICGGRVRPRGPGGSMKYQFVYLNVVAVCLNMFKWIGFRMFKWLGGRRKTFPEVSKMPVRILKTPYI